MKIRPDRVVATCICGADYESRFRRVYDVKTTIQLDDSCPICHKRNAVRMVIPDGDQNESLTQGPEYSE